MLAQTPTSDDFFCPVCGNELHVLVVSAQLEPCSGSDVYAACRQCGRTWTWYREYEGRSHEKHLVGITRPRYWEGRTPPESYYQPPDPYSDPPQSRHDLSALTNYARKTGKKIIEMSYEEVEQFAVCPESDSGKEENV